MDSQYIFEQLALEFDLKSADYYLLDLIPLIEMIRRAMLPHEIQGLLSPEFVHLRSEWGMP